MGSRTAIARGPGALIYNSATFFSKDDIDASLELETSATDSAAYGNVGDVVLDVAAKVSITPLGEWEALATLVPYASTLPGASLFTGTDKPLVIWTLDGEKITFSAAALTKMPTIYCGPDKTLFGPAEFTCLRTDDADWSAANSLFATASASFASYAAFSKAAVLRVVFAAAWGSSPWDAIRTTDGWTVEFNLKTGVVPDAGRGRVDLTFDDMEVMAKCTPIGLTSAQIATALAIQGGSAKRGQSLVSANNLVLTGAGGSPVITLNKPGLKTAGYKFGRTTLRHGEIGFVAQRTFASGVADPLITLA